MAAASGSLSEGSLEGPGREHSLLKNTGQGDMCPWLARQGHTEAFPGNEGIRVNTGTPASG